MRFLNFIPSLFVFALISCASTGEKSGKPHDFCLCGPTINAAGEPQCAIWEDTKNSAQGTKVWASQGRSSCEPADCSQLFSGLCQKIQMAATPRPQPPAPSSSCYCDNILMENDKGQVQLYCAAWTEGAKNLIEYYTLDDCSPQRCGQAPFVLAGKACGNGFKAFYPPLLNKR